jgi:putative transcriptional regulator
LVAGQNLRDRNFFKTVVLMVEHGPDGAMGLVINRPSSVTVAHALSEHFKLPETDDLVFVGGPVEPSSLFIVHNSQDLDSEESPVIPGVHVGSSPGVFERVVTSSAEGNPDLRFRIFCGCAGWGPLQLEGELARGDWYLAPAACETVFHENPYDLWELILSKLSAANALLPKSRPKKPEWN